MMTAQDVALYIIKHNGSCVGRRCAGCPFYYNDPTAPIKKYTTQYCASDKSDKERISVFIQHLVNILGEQATKELLVEELI